MSSAEKKPLKEAEECRQGIQVIARSASILRALGESAQGLSLAEIAQAVSLPRSTVQRIVGALQLEHLVEPVAASGGYRLGSAIGKLFYQTQMDVVSVVRPYITRLSEQFDETTYLSSRVGSRVNVLDRVIAERPLRIVFPAGEGMPVYATAAGKALMAEMNDRELEKLLAGGFSLLTPCSLDRDALVANLERVRTTGVAVDVDECELGVSALAVSLRTFMGVFSAGLVLPTARLPADLTSMERELLAMKQQIEQKIGVSALP